MKLIYKRPDREVWDDGKYIIKKALKNAKSGIDKFSLEDYNRFQSLNKDFVEIIKFEDLGAQYTITMPKIEGHNWAKMKNKVSKEYINNMNFTNYFKWIKSFIDFSMGHKRIFYHSDINIGNVLIDSDLNSYVIDPESMMWETRERFLVKILENYLDFAGEGVISDLSPTRK